MSIEALKKVSMLAQIHRKDELFEALQNFGTLHLLASQRGERTGDSERDNLPVEQKKQRFNRAINYLSAVPNKRKPVSLTKKQDLSELIDKIIALQEASHQASDLKDELLHRSEALIIWGSFHLPPAEDLLGYQLWLYLLPHKHKSLIAQMSLPWKILYSDHQHVWLSVMSKAEPSIDMLPVKHINTDGRSYQDILDQIQDLDIRLEELESERQSYTRYIDHLISGRNTLLDQSQLDLAKSLSFDVHEVFAQQAWVPENRLNELAQLSQTLGFALYVEDVTDSDSPPTLLNNPSVFAGGELLVGFYQMPAYRSWDPSFMVFSSFSVFFALILSDAGYALLLISALLFFAPKMFKSNGGRKLFPLLSTVCMCSIIWGTLVGSYFGIAPTNALLTKIHILDVNNFESMMRLSIACGIFHLLLANVYQVIVSWGGYRAIQHVGWIILLIGSSSFAFYKQDQLIHDIALPVILFGLMTIFICGSNRKVDSLKTFVFRGLDGFKVLTNVTNLFGDVLSYLRLFALGLASASLALTFNQLADNAFQSDSGFHLLFGILILVVGHSLNLVLGIVSGVVHGLRLNYIEFYKWALEGEGYPFRAFKKMGAVK